MNQGRAALTPSTFWCRPSGGHCFGVSAVGDACPWRRGIFHQRGRPFLSYSNARVVLELARPVHICGAPRHAGLCGLLHLRHKYFSLSLVSNVMFHLSMLANFVLVPLMIERGKGLSPIFVTLVLLRPASMLSIATGSPCRRSECSGLCRKNTATEPPPLLQGAGLQPCRPARGSERKG